jgi:site-specific recombinase XerD
MNIELLSQSFCEYSLSFRGYSKNTIRRYRTIITSFRHFTGVNEIGQVTDEVVRSMFYMGRVERRWSVNTYIGYRKTLLVFFRWCMKQGYMEKNPIDDIEKPKLEKRLPIKLTKQDSMKLLELVYNYP